MTVDEMLQNLKSIAKKRGDRYVCGQRIGWEGVE